MTPERVNVRTDRLDRGNGWKCNCDEKRRESRRQHGRRKRREAKSQERGSRRVASKTPGKIIGNWTTVVSFEASGKSWSRNSCLRTKFGIYLLIFQYIRNLHLQESLETREALTNEVAEKHDMGMALRAEVATLEEQCRRANMLMQFKEDIIKDMRRELKQRSSMKVIKSPTSKSCETVSSKIKFLWKIVALRSNSKGLSKTFEKLNILSNSTMPIRTPLFSSFHFPATNPLKNPSPQRSFPRDIRVGTFIKK